MPWEVVKRGTRYCVVQKMTGKIVKCHSSMSRAMAHVRALYANVDEEGDY